jgi:SAM-dependent methyltransferase
VSSKLTQLAGRVPRHVRRKVPVWLRNALVERFGAPAGAFDPARFPRRVNLGCGYDKRPGYLNVDLQDFHAPDLVGDVRSLPQLPSGYYDEVVAQDVLEHLARADGPAALAEWRRLLAPNGRLWLRVPDVRALLGWLADSEDPDRHRDVMHYLFGTQAYDGDYHLAGYTDVMLCDELHRLGLRRITAELRDEWLWELEAYAPAADPATPVAVFWGRGFHRREAGGGGVWRWSTGRSEAMLYAFHGPTDVELAMTLDPGDAEVAGERLGSGANTLTLRLEPGANRLHFRSEHREHAPGDSRELAFRLTAASLAAPNGHPMPCL